MSYIEFYNFLDGKNLCNILANLIVNKINDKIPDAKTEISVVNVRNFFIVKGVTSYDKVLNIAELFQNFLKKYDVELSNKVRVIDSVLYNKIKENEPLNINIYFNKSLESHVSDLQKKLNGYTKEKIYFNLKIHEDTNHIYYDCQPDQISTTITILEKNFPSYTLIKSDFSQEIYISDEVYGLSYDKKLYYYLLWSIKNHIFKLGLGKSMSCSLYSDVNINEIDNLNVNFILKNDDYIVKKEWLESLILDVFPFKLNEISNIYKSSYCLESNVIGSENNYEFNKLNYINDFILV